MQDESDKVEISDIAGLKARVTFELPFCLYLEDGEYAVARDGYAASVKVTRVEQTTLDPRLGIDKTSGAELVRDRYGKLRFSTVDVELPGRGVIEKDLRPKVESGELTAENGTVRVTFGVEDVVDKFGGAAFEEALAAVNRLIEVYRFVTDEFYVRRVSLAEIFRADVVWYHEGEFLGGTHHRGFGQGVSLQRKSFDAQTIGSLRTWLRSTQQVPTAFVLFSDAKDSLDREEYRLAVIDARTALEVLVDGLLLAYFSLSGTSLKDGCCLLDVDPKKIQSLEEALQRAPINRKLGETMKKVLDLDIHKGTPALWKKWLVAKKTREAAAHQGQEVSRSDAFEAVNIMGEVMNQISGALRQASWATDSDQPGEG